MGHKLNLLYVGMVTQLADLGSFQKSRIVMAQRGDMIHENAARHTETHIHPSETTDSQGFALCSAYKKGIDIWLLADTF